MGGEEEDAWLENLNFKNDKLMWSPGVKFKKRWSMIKLSFSLDYYFYVFMQDKQAVELDGLKRYLDFKEEEEK